MSMHSKERILSAFKLEEPDRIPVSILILNTWFDRADERIAADIIEKTDPIISVYLNELYEIFFGKKVKEFSKIIRDKKQTRVTIHTPKGELFQTIEHREESDWIVEPLFKTADDFNKFYSFVYKPHDFESINLNEYIYWNKVIKENGLITFETYNANCSVYELVGPERYYMMLLDSFDAIKNMTEIFEKRLENYVRTIIQSTVVVRPAVFRIVGQEILSRPMGSVEYFDKLMIPYDSKLIKLIHDSGGIVYEHMHGNTMDVIDKKIKMGADAMGPFEAPPAGDITLKEVRDKLSGKVCVYGNLDDMQVLANKDKKNVRLKTFKAIRDAGKGGCYILGGTESSIYNIETAKSFILMSKISSIYGNYPINFKKIEDKIRSLELY